MLHLFIPLVMVVFLSCVLGQPVFLSEDEARDGVSGVRPSIVDVDLEDWGIYNGCLSSHRIQKVRLLDENSAILQLVDGKQVKMHFMESCKDVMQNGFVYTSRNNLFCTHSYSIRVLHTGKHCQVDSLEPYFEREAPVVRDAKDKKAFE
ncbi:MAG: hypothetical protein QNK31_10155 [Porticoccus sp.]|nr:hypothetical protein [Porticoccus sp.]